MITVFGGGGQLAQELAAQAEAAGTALRAVPHAEADIADPQAVAKVVAETAPALVVNAAAYNQVDRAEDDEAAAMRANATGPAVLAEACARAGVPLVHISTDFVFDGRKAAPYVEDDPVGPLGAYARSKLAGEVAVRERLADHYLLRTAWVFGVYGSNFLKTMLRLAAERDELAVVADQVGSPTWTADLARAILAIAGIDRHRFGTYHVAGRGETSRHAFAEAIVGAQAPFTGRRPPVRPVSSADYGAPAPRPAYTVLDTSRFDAAFGFAATDWRTAVGRVVADLLARGPARP